MTTLYKVTGPQGEPLHGGIGAWPLPSNGEPGAWREERGELRKCFSGLHLTDEPARWWEPGCRIWIAEADGVIGSCDDDADRKVVCRRARLMREVTGADELAAIRIYVAGSHQVTGGTVVVAYGSASVTASGSASVRASGSASVEAYGSATVTAYDSVSVRAYDSASVWAYGSASVKAYDSASVTAYDSASVKASGSASVTASGSASVRAYDSASVTAFGSASVKAYDSASVTAYDEVTVVSWWGKPGVRLDNRAVWIERGNNNGTPMVHTAETKS